MISSLQISFYGRNGVHPKHSFSIRDFDLLADQSGTDGRIFVRRRSVVNNSHANLFVRSPIVQTIGRGCLIRQASHAPLPALSTYTQRLPGYRRTLIEEAIRLCRPRAICIVQTKIDRFHALTAAVGEGARLGDVRRDARAGAARRDHDPLPPQPVARPVALPALDGRADGGRRARARGVGRARPAAVPAWVRGAAAAFGAACVAMVVTGTLTTAAGPHPGEPRGRTPARELPGRGLRPRPRDGGVRDPAARAHRVPLARAPAHLPAAACDARRARARLRADGGRRDPVPQPAAVVARAGARHARRDGVGVDGRARDLVLPPPAALAKARP